MQKRRQRFSRHRRSRDGACADRKPSLRDGRDRRSLQPVPDWHRMLLYRRLNPRQHKLTGDCRQRRLWQSIDGLSGNSLGRQRETGRRNGLRCVSGRSDGRAQIGAQRAVGKRTGMFPVKMRIVSPVGSAGQADRGRGFHGGIGCEESSDALELWAILNTATPWTSQTRVHDRHAIGPHDLRARLENGSNRYWDYGEMSALCQRE